MQCLIEDIDPWPELESKRDAFIERGSSAPLEPFAYSRTGENVHVESLRTEVERAFFGKPDTILYLKENMETETGFLWGCGRCVTRRD
jgi:hypothetical protein